MTNREWLMSLSDEDLAKWILSGGMYVTINGKLEQTKTRIVAEWNADEYGLIRWLKGKRG